MARVSQRLEDATHALDRLEEAAYLEHPSDLERDGAIQRFEFTVEAFWKAIQAYLLDQEGVECGSPKHCVRALGESGYASAIEVSALLAMVDDRNLSSHTYREKLAREIFSRVASHQQQMAAVLKRLHPSG